MSFWGGHYNSIKKGLYAGIDLLFPVQCIVCDAYDTWLCESCIQSITYIPFFHCPLCETKSPQGTVCAPCKAQTTIDGAFSCFPYADPRIQSIIHTWKYKSIEALTPHIATMVHTSLKAQQEHPILHPSLLCPIPLHKKRMQERGFNQSAVLAQALAQHIPQWTYAPLLHRVKRTSAQAQLIGIDRKQNMSHAFTLDNQRKHVIQNRQIILVDDVITTGNTTTEAARLLHSAGAHSVWVLTFAYGHPK